MTNPHPVQEAGVSELEIISQQIEEESQRMAPVQLVSFAYRDLPLAALDLSLAGSQLLSNLDEEDQREGFLRVQGLSCDEAGFPEMFVQTLFFFCCFPRDYNMDHQTSYYGLTEHFRQLAAHIRRPECP